MISALLQGLTFMAVSLLLQSCNSRLEIENAHTGPALDATITRSALETVSSCSFNDTPETVSSGNLEFKLVFNQGILPSSFTTSDLSNTGTGGGDLSWALENCGDNRTFKLTASNISGEGTVIPTIVAGSIMSTTGKTNSVAFVTANTQAPAIDTTAPAVIINQAVTEAVGTCLFVAPSDPINTSGFSYRVTFSEAINAASFTTSDISNTGTGGAATLTWSLENCGDDINFKLTAMSVGGAGTIVPVISASGVLDIAGNTNTSSTTTDSTITIETTPPSVTIEQAVTEVVGTCNFTAPGDPSFTTGIEYRVTFSEAIDTSSFRTGDINNGGTGGGTTLIWTITNCGDDTNFKLTASFITGHGTILPSISDDSVKDKAGNNNDSPSVSVDASVEYKLLNAGDTMMAIKQPGGTLDTGGTTPYQIDRGTDNSIVITGFFSGTRNYGGANLVSAAEDGFVVKLSSTGAHVWSKGFGGSGTEIIYNVALDDNDDAYVIGYTRSTAAWTVGGTCSNNMATLDAGGAPSIILIKFRGSDGACMWSKVYGTLNSNYGQALAVSPSGNYLVAAVACSGTVDFGGPSAACDVMQRETVLVKLNTSDASVIWVKRFNSSATDVPHDMPESVAIDALDNIYLSGWMNGTITPESTITLLGTNADGYGPLGDVIDTADTVVWALDSDGLVKWGRRIGSATTSDMYTRLAVDSHGDVAVIGTFTGTTMNFVGSAISGTTTVDDVLLGQLTGTDVILTGRNGQIDMYLAKLRHLDGKLIWARLGTDIGNIGGIIGSDVVIDSSDNIIISGYYNVPTLNGLWSSSFTNLSAGSIDMFFSKFDTDGEFTWGKNHGTIGHDGSPLIVVDTNDDIIGMGVYNTTTDFGLGNLTTDNQDIFMIKLSK